MKALVKKEAKEGLWLVDKPVPTLGPNDVLIRVKQASVCGTDLHIYNWDEWAQKTLKPPVTVGHEFMGVIESMGTAVTGFSLGDRVSGEGHITCSHCRNCRAGRRHLCRNTVGIGIHRDGCFAEYLSLPSVNVFKLSDAISNKVASVLDPLGNAVHTALSFDLAGEDVLITGAGPIGLMAVAICKRVGARNIVVTDVNEYRLKMARQMGATLAHNPNQSNIRSIMPSLGMTEGFDVGLEMSGNDMAFRSMLDAMNHGGKIALLGIFPKPVEIDWSLVIFKGLRIKGIYGREMFETWYKTASLLTSGLDIAPVITHEFPAADFEAAFSTLRRGECGKITLLW